MNILIFGFGNRVVGSILPALSKTFKDINLIDVVNFSGKINSNFENINSVTGINVFDNTNQIKYDFIIISVPSSQQKFVLKKLNIRVNSTILIDTPVDFKVKKYEKYFKIYVLEDIVYIPWIEEVKNLISNLSDLNLFCYYSCHEYHGVALIQKLIQSEIKSFDRKLIKNNELELKIKFENENQVVIISPSDYSKGFIFINSKESNYLIGSEELFKFYFMDYINQVTHVDKIKGLNYIKNLSEYKLIGLEKIFSNLYLKKSDLPTIHDSFIQQKIAKDNRFKIKIFKMLNNFFKKQLKFSYE